MEEVNGTYGSYRYFAYWAHLSLTAQRGSGSPSECCGSDCGSANVTIVNWTISELWYMTLIDSYFKNEYYFNIGYVLFYIV